MARSLTKFMWLSKKTRNLEQVQLHLKIDGVEKDLGEEE